jgi:hypothetical protein
VLELTLHMNSRSVSGATSSSDVLRRNVLELMEWRKWNQADLASSIDRTQPWLSKRLTGKTRFNVDDIERIAGAFLIAPHTLLYEGGIGQWERRCGRDRRAGADRRGRVI